LELFVCRLAVFRTSFVRVMSEGKLTVSRLDFVGGCALGNLQDIVRIDCRRLCDGKVFFCGFGTTLFSRLLGGCGLRPGFSRHIECKKRNRMRQRLVKRCLRFKGGRSEKNERDRRQVSWQ
jgi:hypothetical protein